MRATVSKKKKIENTDVPEMGHNPFPGLRSFTFDDSSVFYGRDSICDQVIEKLLANKFVCLLGGAGSGKTSLIEAGIKPIILSGMIGEPEAQWQIFSTVPGTEPTRNLSNEIFKQEHKDVFNEERSIQEHIFHSIIQRGRHGIIELLAQLNHSSHSKYLFVIDSFEELFRNQQQNGEKDFYETSLQYVNLFLEALQSTRFEVYLLIAIRSDFTDDCVMFPALATYINKSNVMIPRMNRQEMRKALTWPLRALGVSIEDSLSSQILNDASVTEDALPRFQHAMRRTWEEWMKDGDWESPIAQKHYNETGGLRASVAKQANTIFDTLSATEQTVCEIIFKALTERGAESKGFSRQMKVDDLVILAQSDVLVVSGILQKFVQAGLITCDSSSLNGFSLIKLSNITLINAWDRLHDWVEDEAISGQMYKQLALSSASYQVGKTGLLKPPGLQIAINWQEKQKPTLQWARRYNPAFERTMVYLRTSQQAYEAEEALKRKKTKRTMQSIRSLSLVLGTTAVVAVALAIYSQYVKRQAEREQRQAVEEQMEALSRSQQAEKLSQQAQADKGKALQAMSEAERLKMQAEEQSKSLAEQKMQAEYDAQQAMQKSVLTEQNLAKVSKQKEQIEQSAQQSALQKSQAEKEREEALKKRTLTIAQALAVKSQTLQGNPQLKALLALHAYSFITKNDGVEANPDLYNALSGALGALGHSTRTTLKGHSGSVKALASTPRGKTLYSAGSDGRVYAWNMNDATPSPRSIVRSTQAFLCIAVSSNGRWLAVGTDNGSIQLIDLITEATTTLRGHQGGVYAVAFSTDGQTLYSSGSDKKVFSWTVSGGAKTTFAEQTPGIRCLSMSPDGRTLAGGAENGTILLWDITNGQVVTLSSDDLSPVYSLSFNNSGTVLASGDLKGKVRLWNPNGRKMTLALRSHGARVAGIDFSPSGDLMATSSYDGSVYLFDLRNISSIPVVLREPSSWLLSVAFSADGKRLVVATNKPDYMAVYPAQTRVLYEMLCPRVSRDLTTDEWNTYIGSDISYEKACY
jgi:hypothetical protein